MEQLKFDCINLAGSDWRYRVVLGATFAGQAPAPAKVPELTYSAGVAAAGLRK